MDALTIIILLFSLLGAADRILGNSLGLGEEFDKAFHMLGIMALSMIGMIVISPWIAQILFPIFEWIWCKLQIDPSIIPAMLFANDMGGAQLAVEISQNKEIGRFNALIVSSMMGATISFTIPMALGCVGKEKSRWVLLGLLCGIVTIPLGCLIAGVLLKISIKLLLFNLLPLQLFSMVVAIGLFLFSEQSIRIFNKIAAVIKIIITVGLALGIIEFMTGVKLIKGMVNFKEGASICLNACITLTGAFPLIKLLSKILSKHICLITKKFQINKDSAVGFISTLATNVTTFGNMDKMDEKGIVLNSAFAVSSSFVFAGHMAFTRAFDKNYLSAMIIGKVTAGLAAIVLAHHVWNRCKK